MSKKPSIWTEAQRQRVIEWTSYWIRFLSLEPVNVDHDFFEEYHHDAGDRVGVAMDIESDFPYRRMRIRVFRPMAEMENRRVGQSVCHELMHYVVKPMDRYRLSQPSVFCDQQEVVVDQLAMCFENLAWHLDKEKKKAEELEEKLKRRNGKRKR